MPPKKVLGEKRLTAEEKKRKEKEKAQRKVRDEIQAFDHTLRQKRKALGELDIDWKTAECGQEKSLSLLEDEQGTHKQDHNRFNAMKKKAEAVDIGSEMKKPEGLIVPTRGQNFSTVASAPRRSLDGARRLPAARSLDGAPRRGAGGIV